MIPVNEDDRSKKISRNLKSAGAPPKSKRKYRRQSSGRGTVSVKSRPTTSKSSRHKSRSTSFYIQPSAMSSISGSTNHDDEDDDDDDSADVNKNIAFSSFVEDYHGNIPQTCKSSSIGKPSLSNSSNITSSFKSSNENPPEQSQIKTSVATGKLDQRYKEQYEQTIVKQSFLRTLRKLPQATLPVTQVKLQDDFLIRQLKASTTPCKMVGEMCPSPLGLTPGQKVTDTANSDEFSSDFDSDDDSDNNSILSIKQKIPKVDMLPDKHILNAAPLSFSPIRLGGRVYKNQTQHQQPSLGKVSSNENSPYLKLLTGVVRLNYTTRRNMPLSGNLGRTELLDSHLIGLRQKIESLIITERRREPTRGAGFSRCIRPRHLLPRSTASTTIQPYQSSDYVTFTSNSDLNQRAPSNVFNDELHHRTSLSDHGGESPYTNKKRGSQPTRLNNLHTPQLRSLKQDRVSKLNLVEPSSPPADRELSVSRDRECQTLNDRIGLTNLERERAQLRQNYFKPLGARNPNNAVTNNTVILHQRTQQNDREPADDTIVAMGTLVGGTTNGTSGTSTAALKSSRSSSGSTGTIQVPIQTTTTTSTHQQQQNTYLSQSTSGVNFNVRKFNSRYSRSNMSPSNNGQNNHTKHKDEEPRYSDPLLGAHSSFQQRIAELASLEADTVRYERAKKLKKRSKES